MIRKGLHLHGSWHYNLKDASRIFQVIAANSSKLDQLISHRFPLDQVQTAWETQLGGECAKILLKPWADEV
jgi:L-iditol 2-dehydrogenase